MKMLHSCRDMSKSQEESSPISPTLSLGPICRICHDGDSKEDLVTPCNCTGSMAMVHRSCLERWLSSSNSDACEICKFKFVIFREPMPFREWILKPSSPEDCRNLAGDVLCFILLTPLATVSSYLCFTGANSYSSWNVKWEASGLICLSIMLIAIYMTWCAITVRYHLINWRRWRSTHQNVHLLQLRRLSESDHLNRSNNSNTGLVIRDLQPTLRASATATYGDRLGDTNHSLTQLAASSIGVQADSEVVIELGNRSQNISAESTPSSCGGDRSDLIESGVLSSNSSMYSNHYLEPLLMNDLSEEAETKL
ncbi:E3 ubiquitin-protein ligase MARCHF3 [Chamberlinius hualienensis]